MAHTDLQARAFTQIAYMDLKDSYSDYCLENGVTSAPLREILSAKNLSKLRSLGVTDQELDSWTISGVHDTNSDNGFYACIIETGPGEAAVGFRGSEGMSDLNNMKHDWVGADIGLVNSTCTNQQAEVDRFLEQYADQLNGYENLTMAGHSLGGNLAEYATIVSENYGLDDNLSQCYSLDGPGFSDEFIEKYRDKIEKMAPVMYHPRWSLVGTLLHDLPGVNYQFVAVSNDANELDKKKYNAFTRHDTKYVQFDSNGRMVPGEQCASSKITSVISQGLDHLPKWMGDAIITGLGSILIGAVWVKDQLVDEDGHLTTAGWLAIAGGVGLISVFGIVNTIQFVLATTVVLVGFLAVLAVGELVYDLVVAVTDAICKTVSDLCKWTAEKYQQLKELVSTIVEKVASWFRENFDKGYQYAQENPVIEADTAALRAYADRLRSVNSRISRLDGRLDSLYWKVGLLDLWDLMQADILTGYSFRLRSCAGYLDGAAEKFEAVENELTNIM